MGTPSDPDNPNYEIGTECPACIELFAPGKTPRFVTANFEGIEPYPGEPPLPDFPPFILEQDEDHPCRWWAFIGEHEDQFFCVWYINTGDPERRSILDLGWEGRPIFQSYDPLRCIAAFQNEWNGVQGGWAHDGTGCVTWGPNGG